MQNDKHQNKAKGDIGEELAAKYLLEHGYMITHTKWKYERFELDLIAEKGDFIVFVEVKLRYSRVYGEPWEAVNKTKQKKIMISADAFIRNTKCMKEPRFDIISIIQENRKTEILHLEGAFYPFC
ncbi:MAG: YraN family protein [Flavobacteriales bacterium]|nr:YraN family protein [Flavobacteriales bacterium]